MSEGLARRTLVLALALLLAFLAIAHHQVRDLRSAGESGYVAPGARR